ncbi:hypothetical protein U1Q18_052611 [Sarracenia purpurea var. burkii]
MKNCFSLNFSFRIFISIFIEKYTANNENCFHCTFIENFFIENFCYPMKTINKINENSFHNENNNEKHVSDAMKTLSIRNENYVSVAMKTLTIRNENSDNMS